MKKLLALLALTTAVPAMALERPYLGLDAQYNNVDLGDGAIEVQPTALNLRAGSILTEHLGLEAQAAVSIDDDTDDATGVSVKVRDRYSLLGMYRLGMGKGGLSLYAGYSYSVLRLEVTSFPVLKEEEDGASYGVGIDFPVGKGFNLEGDYLIVRDSDNVSISNMSVGLRKYF